MVKKCNIHHFNKCNSEVFSALTKLYNHHDYLVLELFHHCTHQAVTPHSHLTWAAGNH